MEKYNKEILLILNQAEMEMYNLYHPYVGTEHILLSLLKDKEISLIAKQYDLTYKDFKELLIKVIGKSNIRSKYVLYTPLARNILSKVDNKMDLFKEILTTPDSIASNILNILDIDLYSLIEDIDNKDDIIKENCIEIMNKDDILVGREKEINEIIEVLLRKNKNNPILVGDAGVGKTAIIEELSRMIDKSLVPDKLKNTKIYQLDLSSLLSNTKYRGEFETKINEIIKQAINKDVILFIDEIHTLSLNSNKENLDTFNILKPYLSKGKLKIIGATTTKEYDNFISHDDALRRRFKKIYIKEPTKEETINILKKSKEKYEEYHGIKVKDNIIEKIVEYSNKYITNQKNPDKSLEILDCLLSKINNKKNNYKKYLKDKDYQKAFNIINDNNIDEQMIKEVIENMTNIKILNKEDYKNLINKLEKNTYIEEFEKLKQKLYPKFINNELLTLTFNGEKGTGKRYLAKLIGKFLEYNILEIDMQDYMEDTSISRLIGSNPGYIGYDNECIFDIIKNKPYTLLLLNNYEYASTHIKKLIDSIIENKKYIDKYNEEINFNNVLIIKTTNIKNSTIGYLNKNNKLDNTINFDLLDKNMIKKYILNNNIKEEYLKEIPDKITFSSLHSMLELYL